MYTIVLSDYMLYQGYYYVLCCAYNKNVTEIICIPLYSVIIGCDVLLLFVAVTSPIVSLATVALQHC